MNCLELIICIPSYIESHLFPKAKSCFKILMGMQINLIEVILPSTLPVWIIFPNVVKASAPFIHIYAYGLFQKLHEMLTKRFTPYKDQALIFANSTILREVDTCLITSITTLYLMKNGGLYWICAPSE